MAVHGPITFNLLATAGVTCALAVSDGCLITTHLDFPPLHFRLIVLGVKMRRLPRHLPRHGEGRVMVECEKSRDAVEDCLSQISLYQVESPTPAVMQRKA
jgi:hypothetical protein